LAGGVTVPVAAVDNVCGRPDKRGWRSVRRSCEYGVAIMSEQQNPKAHRSKRELWAFFGLLVAMMTVPVIVGLFTEVTVNMRIGLYVIGAIPVIIWCNVWLRWGRRRFPLRASSQRT